MKRLTLVISAIILFTIIAAAGIFLYKSNSGKPKEDISQKPDSITETSKTDSETSQVTKNSEQISNQQQFVKISLEEEIEKQVNAKKYDQLAPFMSNPISVTIRSTECCGEINTEEAASQLKYLDEGAPYNFDQTNTKIKDLKTKSPQLANSYLGISKINEQVIAFTIKNGKITQIELSVSWRLYDF